MAKVFVGLSGGVDSAVSAALLQKEGHEVTGVFIRIVVPGYPCTAGQDRLDAMRVAAHLRIPFIEVDFSKEYQQKVFNVSLKEFAAGKTPNPDTLCNKEIKFGLFYNFAKSRGADFVATGHYARVAPQNDLLRVRESSAKDSLSPRAVALRSPSEDHSVSLLAGADPDKDQSYFLWQIPETVLRHTLFPIGHLQKSQVRQLAKKFGLPNAERPDSQGLCFLGPVSVGDMLARELSPKPGQVLNEAGKVVGRHDGVTLYTLGQRHGFTLLAHTPETSAHFVIARDMDRNTITVSPNKFPTHATRTTILLSATNWIGPQLSKGSPCSARYRYRQALIPAVFTDRSIILEEPHYVPEGQSLVLYDGTRCLGGGVIKKSELQ